MKRFLKEMIGIMGTYYPYIITKSGVCGRECIVKGIDRITNFETTDI